MDVLHWTQNLDVGGQLKLRDIFRTEILLYRKEWTFVFL